MASRTGTRSTTSNDRRHNAETAAARTARRGRDETRSLAAAIRQRRPSDNSSVALRLTLRTQRQHIRTAERQLVRLRNFNVRQSPSGTHSDNFNVDYYCGYFRSPREQLSYSSSVPVLHCVSVIHIDRLTGLLRRTFTRRSLKYLNSVTAFSQLSNSYSRVRN